MLLTPCTAPLQDLVTSLLMWLAVCLYSPLLALLSAVGAVIGTILPLLFLGLSFYSTKVFISELQLLKTIPQSTLDSGVTAASCPWPLWPGHSSPSQCECLIVCLIICSSSTKLICLLQKISVRGPCRCSVHCLCPEGSPKKF